MTPKREIINEKLQSIDHKLDVDHLWTELETMLPPEQRRRRPLLWLWSLMAVGIVVVASIVALQTIAQEEVLRSAPEVNPMMSSQLTPEPMTQYATTTPTKQDVNADERAKREDLLSKDTDSQAITNLGSAAESPTSRTAVTKTQVGAVTAPPLVGEVGPESRARQGNGTASTQLVEISQMNSTHSLDQLTTKTPTLAATVAPEYAITSSIKDIFQLPFLPSLEVPSVRPLLLETTEKMPSITMVEPLKTSISPLTVSMVGTYGIDLSGAKSNANVMSLADGESLYEHVDVAGLELALGYDLLHSWGVSAGVRYQKYTDRLSSFRTGDVISISDASGGFSITNEDFIVYAYNETDAVDVSLGLYHSLPLTSGLALRPEIGGLYNVSLQSEETFILEDVSRNNFVESTQVSGSSGLGYYGKLGLEARLSPAVILISGVSYGVRSLADQSIIVEAMERKQRVLSGQLGLQYRF